MPFPCLKPKVSIDPDSGRIYVWTDENGDRVGLMLGRNGIWAFDVPTAYELMDNFEPVYDKNEALMLAQPAINIIRAIRKQAIHQNG